MCRILLRLILKRVSCSWVPSPQSIMSTWSLEVTTWEVGCRSAVGMAELLPKIVTPNIYQKTRKYTILPTNG